MISVAKTSECLQC